MQLLPITIVAIIFSSAIIVILVIGLTEYFKKRLEHKQILAAIEKGIPLSELKPPKPQPAGPSWIRYISVGIALVVVALVVLLFRHWGPAEIVIAVLMGTGVAWTIRGLLHRKYELKSQQVDQNGTVLAETPPAVPAAGISQQSND
jgi:UDP-N-acetylmuramyl pentapeptide phosphotransferase/UDP-N-acetylglucosamine-1-phosphate transferase